MSVKNQIFDYLIKNDVDSQYQAAINQLSKKYSFLYNFSDNVASKCDDDVVATVEILANICNDIDELEKVKLAAKLKEEDVELDFYAKTVLKTLKVSQTLLLGLMFRSPWKVGIAYNALHFVIKYIEKDLQAKARAKIIEKQKR